jgi:hypothetical protein
MRFSSNNISPAVRLLAYSGLVPFIGLAALSFLVSPAQRPTVIFSLLAYGATIVSFLGAIHWGLTMIEPPQINHNWFGVWCRACLLG